MDAMTLQMRKYKAWFTSFRTSLKKFFKRADLEMQCKFCSKSADLLRSYSEIELDKGRLVKYKEYAICMRCVVRNKTSDLVY